MGVGVMKPSKRFSGRSKSQNGRSKYYKERNRKLQSGEIKSYRLEDLMVLNPELVEESMRRLM